MKVVAVHNNAQATDDTCHENPSFKSAGMGALGLTGAIMQGIESKGYFASFLIQDGLGMTVPRVITGFHRDKEITGEYNIKEGFEVLGREGLTGPFLISVAPATLAIAGFACKSAGTNTRLIKIIGNNLKTVVKNPKLSQSVKKDKELFKKEFYRLNIKKFYKDTIPNDKEFQKSVDYIMQEFAKLDSKSKKVRNEGMSNILNKLQERTLETSSDLENICNLAITVDGKKRVFTAESVINAIKNYGDDAISKNKDFASINEDAAENIKNNLASKRLGFNIGTVALTLTGLSLLPKIYAHSDVAPGAVTLAKQKENAEKENQASDNSNTSFKGKGINNNNWWAKIGKYINKSVPEWFQKEFEYTGINFTPTLMSCLSIFGLIIPRGLRAYNRAYVDENGNKDLTELHEILVRDPISSIAVAFTVPILTKCIVNSYESHQGFILTNRASKDKPALKKFIDMINPFSDLRVYTNEELAAIYDNITNKTRMLHFVEYIDSKGGDLEKILSKSTNTKAVFNEGTFTLESIKGKSLKEKNKQIIDLFKNMKDGQMTDELITKLMKDSGNIKQSTITRLARGLNSVPGFIVTVLISPIILGWFIPRLTYSMTQKTHEKMIRESSKNNTDIAKKSYVV